MIDVDDLVYAAHTVEFFVREGDGLSAVEFTRERVVERLIDKRRFSRAAHAGHGDERAERDIQRDVLEVVPRRAAEDERFAVPLPAGGGDCDTPFPPKILGGVRDRLEAVAVHRNRVVAGFEHLRTAGGDEISAVLPRTGSEVDDVVGALDHLLVVFDDDDRIPQVAELLERGDEPDVVPLVKADARLVEYIQNADEL